MALKGPSLLNLEIVSKQKTVIVEENCPFLSKNLKLNSLASMLYSGHSLESEL